MDRLVNFSFTVYRLESNHHGIESRHWLFQTEVLPLLISLPSEKRAQRLKEWRRELQLQYFPQHTGVEQTKMAVIELADGLRILFVLTWTLGEEFNG